MKENIIQCKINRKYEFLNAILNIKQSCTGRMDANIANTFIQEAAQMIINAISILEQVHLMCESDVIEVRIAKQLPNISKVYCYGGLLWYFTDNKIKRKKQSWNSNDFCSFEKNTNKYNMLYDEAYISCLKTREETFFIEHNHKLSENDISLIEKLENEINNIICN